MKLPNGYGSVKKLSGKRRRPWIVTKTIGWEIDDATQKAIQKKSIIGYYATRQEGLQALADYNNSPYDIDTRKITFSEVYEKWSEQKYKETSVSSIKGYRAAYKLCSSLYDMRMADIKLNHLQGVVDNSGKNAPVLKKLKVFYRQIFEYAVIHEIITQDKNVASYVNIRNASNPDKRKREPFNPGEIESLWKNTDSDEYVSTILMLIYSGCRISELLNLEKTDVNLEEQCFHIRKAKTQSGVRTVPIADKTLEYFKYWYHKNDCCYLLSTPKGQHFTYQRYYESQWKSLMRSLGMTHCPHDTRHTCISLLASANVQPTTIKKIVGHSGAESLTERIYTHLDIKELRDAINRI